MTDRIEKTIELKAPVSRVWRALTDHREFGAWFRVRLEGPSCRARSRAARSPIPATSTHAGRRSCRRWSPSGCSPSPGILTPSIPAVTIPASRRRWSNSRWRDRDRHPAARRRIGLRQDSGAPPRRGVPHERPRLDSPDQNIARHVEQSVAARPLEASASVFAALGDETRLGLLAKLTTGEPQSIARLTSGTRLTRQAVTKHLRVLEGAGVVRAARVGRESRFALDPEPIDDAQPISTTFPGNGTMRWRG